MKQFLQNTILAIFLFLYWPDTINAAVFINEFLPNPTSPAKEWVEFYNPDQLDLTSYFLDDDLDFNSDSGSSAKKSLSSIVTSDPAFSYYEMSSFLNNDGDYVALFDSNGTLVNQYEFTDSEKDISIGRSSDGGPDFIFFNSPTKGATNNTNTPTPTSTPTSTPTPIQSGPTPTPQTTATPKPTATIKITAAPASTPKVTVSPTTTPNPTQILAAQITGVAQKITATPAQGTEASLSYEIIDMATPEAHSTPSSSTAQTGKDNNQTMGGVLLVAGALLSLASAAFYLFQKRKIPPLIT